MCARHQHRLDFPHNRQHRLCDRLRIRQANRIQPSKRIRQPDSSANQQSISEPASGPGGESGAWEMLPPLHPLELLERAVGVDSTWNTKEQHFERDSDAEEHGGWQLGRFRLPRPAAAWHAGQRTGDAVCAGGAEPPGPADRPRA